MVFEIDDMETCRTCGHFYFLHQWTNQKANKYGPIIMTQACDPQKDHGCDCGEFVPEDNLLYVVWADQKRKGALK